MNRLCPACDEPLEQIDLNLYVCRADDLYLDPRSNGRVYSDDYLLHYKLYERTELSTELCRLRWDFIESHVDLTGKTVLDFGCGADAFGNMGRKDDKIKMLSYDPHFNQDHRFLNYAIDVLTFWDSFEHMGRLQITPLIEAQHIFMSLPIVNDVGNLLNWKHYVPYEHIWYFSSRALRRLFQKWGYEMVVQVELETELRSKGVCSFYFRKS